MNIAVMTMYGNYYNGDKLFDRTACNIGQNLLLPGIRLKEYIETNGDKYHTYDVYKDNNIDKLICFDIPSNSYFFNNSIQSWVRYLLMGKWLNDGFSKLEKTISVENRILIVQEPPVVSPKSYNMDYHKYFGKILTWNPDLVDNKKYFDFKYPQPVPEKLYSVPFTDKKMFTQISGNKKGVGDNELYSERKKVIDFFEQNDDDFEFYGFGWEKENLKTYKGRTDDKLETLSQYKFSFTFENCSGLKGYVTEKIFDCFFAGTVPIYWGAEDIDNYIPEECYIDYRKFKSIEEVVDFCQKLTEEEYEKYRVAAKNYLNSDYFKENFSVEAYVERMCRAILD
ncbi:Glycosyltransferase family 10 (fucosyltransferase) C-term [Pseudobutyrivibrio sp. 49]|uniref:glycosyltransferase family 10 domain-containing protein n=1 Tax=Pseudobutyrivibrio sp. 49 TaxID=1855344 RepID=UPI000890992E|nr:glycosyltransferase family 10 [Pseudobutyrivibrio sp. 49]SDH60460.1 Glycosyltransferase family 10 (fucosyltransferase) C-term [Pseudobutyrivibrio sp. 49]